MEEDRRLIKAAIKQLWKRGEIEGMLYHSGQAKIDEIYNSLKGSVITLNVSRQWGKTYYGVVKAIAVAIRKPGARIRIGAAFETDLNEFIQPTFEMALASCPMIYRPRYTIAGKKYYFPNGSNIKLVGLDRKPNGLRGNSIDLIVIDEAGFVSRLDYLYHSVIVPLTTHKPEAKIVLLSTPPESPSHEFWDFVDRARLNGSYAELTIDQNPLLTKEDVARIEREMGGRESTAFQREYLCRRIVESERAIIPEWSPIHEISFNPESDPMYPYWHKYQFMDIGVQIDKTVCLFGHYNFKEAALYITDEVDISGSKTTTRLIADTIKQKESEIGFHSIHKRVADSSHPLLLNDLSSEGIHFYPTDKSKLHEMVNELRIWVKSGRVKVDSKCKQTIGCLQSGIWDKKRAAFDRSKVFGHFDALAALVYAVRNIDTYTNPIPQYVTNPQQMPVLFKESGISPMARDFQNILKGRR